MAAPFDKAAFREAFTADKRLTGNDVRVLLLLLRHASRDGKALRSQAKMAAELGLWGRGSVQKIVRRLEGRGYLGRTHAVGRSSTYQLTLPDPQLDLFADASPAPRSGARPDSARSRVPDSTGSPPPTPGGVPHFVEPQESEPQEKKKRAEPRPCRTKAEVDAIERRLHEAAGDALDTASSALISLAIVFDWIDDAGCGLEEDIVPAIRRVARLWRGPRKIGSWDYFHREVILARDRRLDGLPDNVTVLQPRGGPHVRSEPGESAVDAALRRLRGDDAS